MVRGQSFLYIMYKPGRIAQAVAWLTTNACLTADQGVGSSTQTHYFVEIDHEIISSVILLIQEGLLSVTSKNTCTIYWLISCSSLPRKKGNKTNKNIKHSFIFLPISFNICFGCSKEPSHGSFEYPQHMFWLKIRKLFFDTHS